MSDQATIAPDDEVWARTKATGRKKKMTRARRDILVRLGQWEACDPPGDDASRAEVVRSFPSMPPDHGGENVDAVDGQPARPPASASKAAWVEFAVTQGVDRADAEKATRDELVAGFEQKES